jgi:hypothetical protein
MKHGPVVAWEHGQGCRGYTGLDRGCWARARMQGSWVSVDEDNGATWGVAIVSEVPGTKEE